MPVFCLPTKENPPTAGMTKEGEVNEMRTCKICGKLVTAGMTDGSGELFLHEAPCFEQYMDKTYGKHCWTKIGGKATDGFGGYYIVKDDNEPAGFRGTGIYYTEWEDDDGQKASAANQLENNPYFQKMKSTGEAWEKGRVERMLEKREIVKQYGRDSDELKKWYERENGLQFPFSEGQSRAYRGWFLSVQKQSSELEYEDLPWDKDVPAFLDAIRAAGFTSFVVTDQSTALMRILHAFFALGCTMTGLCHVTRREDRWGAEEPYQVDGIRVELDSARDEQGDYDYEH